jgi:cytochrome c553
MRELYVVAAVMLASVVFGATAAPAQVMNMQDVAQALGVKCEYCHARMGQSDAQRDAQPAAQQAPAPSRVDRPRHDRDDARH